MTLDQMNLIDIYRTFQKKQNTHSSQVHKEKYTFFSSAQGTFSRREYMLGHRASLGKFKEIEIISSIFSDHNTMRPPTP